MHQHIAHIDDIAPGNFWVVVSEFFCKQISSLTNNHDIMNYRMIAHNI